MPLLFSISVPTVEPPDPPAEPPVLDPGESPEQGRKSRAPLVKKIIPKYRYSTTVYDEAEPYDTDETYDGGATIQAQSNDRIKIKVEG